MRPEVQLYSIKFDFDTTGRSEFLKDLQLVDFGIFLLMPPSNREGCLNLG